MSCATGAEMGQRVTRGQQLSSHVLAHVQGQNHAHVLTSTRSTRHDAAGNTAPPRAEAMVFEFFKKCGRCLWYTHFLTIPPKNHGLLLDLFMMVSLIRGFRIFGVIATSRKNHRQTGNMVVSLLPPGLHTESGLGLRTAEGLEWKGETKAPCQQSGCLH